MEIVRETIKIKKTLTLSSEFTGLCVARNTSLHSGTPSVISVNQRIKFSFVFPRQATCFKSVSHQSLIFKNLLFLFTATEVTWECRVPYILGFLVLFVFVFSYMVVQHTACLDSLESKVLDGLKEYPKH